LNGIARDITFTAASEVPDSFRVRSAIRRVYRYFEPDEDHDFDLWQTVAPRFSGSIDVRSFGRAVPSAAPVWRTVESVRVVPRPGGAVIEISAPSFVWGMVRKIVAALREVEASRVSVAQLESALHGRLRLTLPMAEPERLVLWNVEFPIPWQHSWAGPNRHQSQWGRAARDAQWVRQELLEALAPAPRPGRAPEAFDTGALRDER
jgi:tRNA U38,U39,U40 pseudouridine synthase TruA